MSEPTSDGLGDERPPTSAPPPPPPATPGHAAGAASVLSSDVRMWAMLTHLSAFVGAWLALAFVGPMVIWLIKREEHPFLDRHGKEALNFNLSFLLYIVVGGLLGVVLSLVTFGLAIPIVVLAGGAVAVGWIALTIVAAVRANNGEDHRYPATIRFVS